MLDTSNVNEYFHAAINHVFNGREANAPFGDLIERRFIRSVENNPIIITFDW